MGNASPRSRNAPVTRQPFGGKRVLINGVSVRFGASVHTHVFDCGELVVRPGDTLVLQTDKGLQLGTAITIPERRVESSTDVWRIVRRANDSDVRAHERCEELQRKAMRRCVELIRELKLTMKLIEVEYLLDQSKALFYFTSEKRVDFRQLVRSLAKDLRVRIEMRQIGVRDGAGVIGGIGPCGRQLCCSSFLKSFRSVSVRHAKVQGLSLNPQKVTGMCGRLKCCLTYEEPVYKEMKKYAPRRGLSVLTSGGPGNIVDVDPVGRRITVRFAGGTQEMLHLRDVVVLDRKLSDEEIEQSRTREEAVMARRRQRSGGARSQMEGKDGGEEYLWADADHDLSFFSALSDSERSEPKEKEAADKDSETDKKPRRRRRKRRRRSKKSGGSD